MFNIFKKRKLKEREEQLVNEMKHYKLSQAELLYPYQVPSKILKLLELQAAKIIPSRILEFELYWNYPVTPSPIDLIPFAMTGGDSCHFAFITDFGSQADLESCPIAFISPTDYDRKKPLQANFLIARDIEEFLSLMIAIVDFEFIRFKDIYSTSINDELLIDIEESLSERTEAEIKDQLALENTLKSEFDINPINDFYSYFKAVRESRFSKNCYVTTDGLGLKCSNVDAVQEVQGDDLNTYIQNLSKVNRPSKLVAIRNAPFIFAYYKVEYVVFLKHLVEVFKELQLKREERILIYENKSGELIKEYYEVRRKRLNKKK